jgi:hypothetical protein
MNLTGQDLIDHFISCCRKRNKLFVPDSPRQEQVAKALAEFYDKQTLLDACDLYIKANPGPFLIFDFAVQSKQYIDKVIYEGKAADKFKNIVEQTRRKMEEQ